MRATHTATRSASCAFASAIAGLSFVGMTLAGTTAGLAQTAQPQTGIAAPQTGQKCTAQAGGAATKAEPATQPDRASADGTAPGNSGSTGWTGGTGGAYIGNNPQGATHNSPNWQPPTARGLDLSMKADPAPAAAPSVAC